MMEYSENYRVEFRDCDENRRLKLPAMVALLMQVSEHQLSQGGAGTNDLVKRGLGWVVTQYHFEINALPQPGDQIILSTNASGYNRFFEYRDFSIKTAKGRPLVKVNSQWVLFDLQKRHLVPTDVTMMQKWQVPELKKMPRFPCLRAKKEYAQKRPYRARYDDLDTNHHVTNSHYFSWFVDMLKRDFLRQHIVQTIDLKFDKEVHYGEQAYSCMNLKQTGQQIMSEHAIETEAGTVQAVCEIKWRQI